MYAQPAAGINNPVGYWLITLRQPHVAAYEFQQDSLIHPRYLMEKLGNRGGDLLDYNGGDVYAILKCVHVLIGVTYPAPDELFQLSST